MRCSTLPALALALVAMTACAADSEPASPFAPEYAAIEGVRMGGSIYQLESLAPGLVCGEFGMADEVTINKRAYLAGIAIIGSAAENRKVASLLGADDRCCVLAGEGAAAVALSPDGTWYDAATASCVVVELKPLR